MRESKNRKTPGTDNLNMELFTHALKEVKYRFLDILNQCWSRRKIPEEWKAAPGTYYSSTKEAIGRYYSFGG
jgi:hypothetical protein